MADRSVTVRFRTREEDYLERNPDGTLAGFNSRGEPLRARLEIDTDKTAGSEPYKLAFNVAQNRWIGQDVFLKYSSNADPGTPITVRTTNGTAVLTEQNVVSEERTETIVFTNESEKQLSGIPSAGTVQTEWVGNVLAAGSPDGAAASLCAGEMAPGPNVTFDGESLHIPDSATGVLKATYTETFARIKSNAAELGTVVVAVCQGRLAEAEQYETEYTQTSWNGGLDSECCQKESDLSIRGSFSAVPGFDTGVFVSGGCPPFAWEISGTGFSVKNPTTEARLNTVSASEEACGDGILKVTDACGVVVESLIDTDVGCCSGEGWNQFEWAEGTPDALCMSGSRSDAIAVTGGVPPYTWAIVVGDDVASLGNSETQEPVNTIFNTASEYTTVRVRVKDACLDAIYRDFRVGMEWAEDNPQTVGQDDEVAVSVVGGIGPFTWSVSGTGFSMGVSVTEDRTNLLFADESACGPAEITVTDSCGDNVEGVVRSTEGTTAYRCGETTPSGFFCGTNYYICTEHSGVWKGKYWTYPIKMSNAGDAVCGANVRVPYVATCGGYPAVTINEDAEHCPGHLWVREFRIFEWVC